MSATEIYPPHVQAISIRLIPPDPQGALLDRLSDDQVLKIVGGK